MELLVIDSNAIIRGMALNLFKSAKTIVTTQDVLDEIRDSASRELLERLPYEIEVMNPAEEDLRAVATFAVKSGDFAALSKTDLRIIALTKTLHDRFHQKSVASLSASLPVAGNNSNTAGSIQQRSAAAPVVNAWGKRSFVEKVTMDGESGLLFEDDSFPALSSRPDFESEEDEKAEKDTENGPEIEKADKRLEMVHDDEIGDIAESRNDHHSESVEENESITEVLSEHNEGIVQDMEMNPVGAEGRSDAGNDSEQVLHISPPPSRDADLIPNSCGCEALHSDAQQLSIAELSEFTPVLSQHRHETRSISSSHIASSTTSTGQRRKLTKDEANDDGVGWITSSNMEQASQITRWTAKAITTKNVAGADGSCLTSSAISQEKRVSKVVSAGSQTAAPKASSSTTKPISQAVTANESKVACCTSDFAMQNVLLQLGLVVISVDGLRIRRLRTAVLRCNACFHVHSGSAKELTRIFCAKCGGNTLSRVNATLAADGTIQLHLKKGYTLSTKGTQYSMPAPGKQPRFQGELLTREDQLLSGIWKQKTLRVKKEVKSVFGEDVTSEVGLHLNKGFDVKVGLGKQNPNAKKGRERRGKRKVNNAIK